VLDVLPVQDFVAAVSVGIIDGEVLLDLNFEEDSSASVDMNVVITGSGKFIELQGTAEQHPFTQGELSKMIDAAKKGIGELVEIQRKILGEIRVA
jgi:ribonuclease PH